ncbi:unnamed protein product [Allacma fusca]|uniref:Uncharacterized protein n=1 Tax=Allacma fusca TaxID=39272 RepID=A0A8J2Q5T4_9HEXA|nr:unnamed protein product [Allacma fusca]
MVDFTGHRRPAQERNRSSVDYLRKRCTTPGNLFIIFVRRRGEIGHAIDRSGYVDVGKDLKKGMRRPRVEGIVEENWGAKTSTNSIILKQSSQWSVISGK